MTKEAEKQVEVDIDLDDKNCPVAFKPDGKMVMLEGGEKIPKSFFFGKDSPCDDTFHGKHQFYLYMSQWYKETAELHAASKDPKVKKQQKISKLKEMLAALEKED